MRLVAALAGFVVASLGYVNPAVDEEKRAMLAAMQMGLGGGMPNPNSPNDMALAYGNSENWPVESMLGVGSERRGTQRVFGGKTASEQFLGKRLPSAQGNRYDPEPLGERIAPQQRGNPYAVAGFVMPRGQRSSGEFMAAIPAPPMRFRNGPDLTLPNYRGFQGDGNPGEMDKVADWGVRGGAGTTFSASSSLADARYNPQTRRDFYAGIPEPQLLGSPSGLVGGPNGSPMGPVSDPHPAAPRFSDPNQLHFTNPPDLMDPMPPPTEQVPVPEEYLTNKYYDSKRASGGPGYLSRRDLEPADGMTAEKDAQAPPEVPKIPMTQAAEEAESAEKADEKQGDQIRRNHEAAAAAAAAEEAAKKKAKAAEAHEHEAHHAAEHDAHGSAAHQAAAEHPHAAEPTQDKIDQFINNSGSGDSGAAKALKAIKDDEAAEAHSVTK